MEGVTEVDSLCKSEFQDMRADILLNKAVVADPLGPGTPDAALMDPSHQGFDRQIASVGVCDSLFPDIEPALDLLPLVSFEYSQNLIETVILHVDAMLLVIDIINPSMEDFRLESITLDHQGNIRILLTEC
jgi:hypothetical protein